MEGQDVDPAAGPISTDLHLALHKPTIRSEAAPCVGRAPPVNEIGRESSQTRPLQPQPVPDAERHEEAIENTELKIPAATTLDSTDLSLGYTRTPTQLALAPGSVDSRYSNGLTDDIEQFQPSARFSHRQGL
jgi:hypothetical protein